MKQSPARKAYHHGNLRNVLIEAGARLLRDHGVAGLTLRAVAERAGVSHAAPYRHFRDKAGLLSALARVGFEDLIAAMTRAIEKYPRDPSKQLTETGVAYVLMAVRNPNRTQLMFGGVIHAEAADEQLLDASNHAFDGLVRIMENGLKMGIYEPHGARQLALSAWATMHGLATLIIAGCLKEGASSERQVAQLTRYTCQMLQHGLLKS